MATKELFCDGWKFKKYPAGSFDTCIRGGKLTDLDMSGAREVQIPHDWLMGDTNHLYETNDGVYVKELFLERIDGEKKLALRFEGIYMDCSIFVNGCHVLDWKYGYSTFEADITDFVHSGRNEIAVGVRYRKPSTRWYSGAGIFRPVWLKTYPKKSYIPADGIYIHAEAIENKEHSDYLLHVECEMLSEAVPEERELQLVHTLKDAEGNVAAQRTVPFTASDRHQKFPAKMQVVSPKEWDVNAPYLYRLETKVLDGNGAEIDREETVCAFRMIEFEPTEGFLLNGRKVKLHGACLQHDKDIPGVVENRGIMRERLLKMREAGINVIRTSHNIPPVLWMELCDELGILMVSEGIDYEHFFQEYYRKDVASWIRRDRNHPCVIVWLLGDESGDTLHQQGDFAKQNYLAEEIRKYDAYWNAYVASGVDGIFDEFGLEE